MNKTNIHPHDSKDAYKALKSEFNSLKSNGTLKPKSNCECCGITQQTSSNLGKSNLTLHHSYPLKWKHEDAGFKHNSPANLITLCHWCHQSYHQCFEDDLSTEDWLGTINPKETLKQLIQTYKDKYELLKHKLPAWLWLKKGKEFDLKINSTLSLISLI